MRGGTEPTAERERQRAEAAALRASLEQRLRNRSLHEGLSIDRLRRQVTVERLLARLEETQPGQWVLKGGMALEVRLGGVARATKDLDLGLRLSPPDQLEAVDLLAEALVHDAGDHFNYAVTRVKPLTIERAGDVLRASVQCRMAGREWATIQIDIGIRAHELAKTERLRIPGSLEFAGIAPPTVETIDLARHVAEKFHGVLLQFEDRENTRTRDLADLVLLAEHGLIDPAAARVSIVEVFAERETALPPALPALPTSWPSIYTSIAEEHGIRPASFDDAVNLIAGLWADLFPSQET